MASAWRPFTVGLRCGVYSGACVLLHRLAFFFCLPPERPALLQHHLGHCHRRVPGSSARPLPASLQCPFGHCPCRCRLVQSLRHSPQCHLGRCLCLFAVAVDLHRAPPLLRHPPVPDRPPCHPPAPLSRHLGPLVLLAPQLPLPLPLLLLLLLLRWEYFHQRASALVNISETWSCRKACSPSNTQPPGAVPPWASLKGSRCPIHIHPAKRARTEALRKRKCHDPGSTPGRRLYLEQEQRAPHQARNAAPPAASQSVH